MTAAADVVPAPGLQRDRLTTSLYLYVASWSWFLSALGPALVILREEQSVSRATISLHSSAVAAGSVASALLLVRLGRRFGRWALLQGSGVLMVVCGLAFVLGPAPEVTLPAALLLGAAGCMGLNVLTAVLAQHHHEKASAAISEANAAGSTIGLLAPLAVGAAVSLTLGWRPAVAMSLVLAAGCLLGTWGTRRHSSWVPTQVPRVQGDPSRPLGLAFWCVWVAMAMFIAVEFSSVYWAADLLATDHGLSSGVASASVSAFVGGMAAGRWVVGSLALRFAGARLLGVGLALAFAGWVLLWAGPGAAVAAGGLALCGVGTGWLYPLGVSVLIARSEGRADTAVGLGSLAAGLSMGAAPFALAVLADAVGTHDAFLLVPAAIALGALGVGASVVVNRRRLRRARGPAGVPAQV